MGQGAEDADGFFEGMRDLRELQDMLFGREAKSRKLRIGLKERFEFNANAKVGMKLKCPVCNTAFDKVQWAQKFCGKKTPGKSNCKDFYHNFVQEERRLRAELYNR